MRQYTIPALRQLARRAMRDSRVDRQRQVERAEAVAAGLTPVATYPVRQLCEQIVAERAGRTTEKPVSGQQALHDLRLFVDEVSAGAAVDIGEVHEPVWTVQDVSEHFHVSSKSVERWRERGLMSRRFIVGGRTRIGFLESSVRRFVREHGEEVERGRRFTQMNDVERAEIIDHASRLARHGVCKTEVAHRLAEFFNRSPETMRYTIQQHDKSQPEQAVFPNSVAPLTAEQKFDIYQKNRRGVSPERLAKQFGRTKASIYRVLGEVRAAKLLEPAVDYMDSPEFHEKQAAKTVLGAPPEVNRKGGTMRAPTGLPPYLASLYTIPLLTREEEQYWFRKMNFLKFRAAKLQASINPKRPRASDLDQLEAHVAEATEIKNFLIRSNLRLVVSIAKKHIKPTNNFFEMVSDGNMSLIRAIEKFDYTKGNKFSTYATWAIMKNFARSIPAEHKRLDRFRTGKDEIFSHSTEKRGSEFKEEVTNRRQHRMIMEILGQLDGRERDILVYRYGLSHGEEPLTLEQVGQRFGVTKERIRQLEGRALKKLRKIAEEEKLEIPGLEE